MIVLLNALQAGNSSGTGRYTTELARWLPVLAGDLDFVVLWPRHLPHPHMETATREAFLLCDARTTLKRLYMDQIGIHGQRARARANVVHYPASVGCLSHIHNAVATVHDLSCLHEPRWFRPGRAAYYRYAIGRTARVAERLIADSQATAEDLHEKLGIARDRIDVVPLGVDERYRPASPEAVAAARAKYALPERFFLYLGTIEPRKNIVRLIEAWSRVATACPLDLVIAGRLGWRFRPIIRALAAAPFPDRIRRPGFIAEEDLPALLTAAEAFVWPSLWEGFGLPPLEAMACGTPVLTSNASSLPEVVGDAALMVDPCSVDAIAEGMLRLAEDPALRAKLRSQGLQRAAAYTWRRTAEGAINTYRTVLHL